MPSELRNAESVAQLAKIACTTYFDMFGSGGYCLLARDELAHRFSNWTIKHSEFRDFDMPGGRVKSFVTLIAQKAEDRL